MKSYRILLDNEVMIYEIPIYNNHRIILHIIIILYITKKCS